MHEISAWSGLDWGALPYESTLSIVWRFAWRNALTANVVWELSGISAARTYPPPFFGEALQDWGIKWLAERTGLKIPPQQEVRLIGGRNCVGEVLRRGLAICPVCARAAYHSFFFQLPFLDVCPIHDVPLTTRCLSCNAPLCHYDFTRQLFQPDWGCVECHGPIGGHMPDLRAFLDLREQAQVLERVFTPFVRWVEDVNRLGVGFERLTLCPHAPRRYARALVESAICMLRRPPRPAISPNFKVLCLNWHLRLRPPRPKVHITQSGAGDNAYDASSNLKEFLARFNTRVPSTPHERERCSRRESTSVLVYKATIRRIQQWLLERHVNLGLTTKLNVKPRFNQGRLVVEGWDIYELSYLLLRFWCEGGIGMDLTVSAKPSSGAHYVRPSFAMAGDRVLRIPLRVAILAAYGTVVCAVRSSELAGEFLTLPSIDHLERMLAYGYRTDSVCHTGLVIVPDIEDLMSRFPEICSKMDELWAENWQRMSVHRGFLRSHTDFQPAKRRPLL
ncbi:hypothetical protein BZM27_37415 [Paraburkholderia steynii]|uniref:TniQ family protein n=1 Tax=Paraburkholderia steynii TaxID=1245441 RepID=A0A4R0XCY3_9BURK|nr:hypothetical protein BZM27_37415 [Paraburkholderia steynii]